MHIQQQSIPNLLITIIIKAQLCSQQRITLIRWMATSYLKSINILVATQFLTLFLKTYLTQWMGFITKKKKNKKTKTLSSSHALSQRYLHQKKPRSIFKKPSRQLPINLKTSQNNPETTPSRSGA
jgi:hypothetical protein